MILDSTISGNSGGGVHSDPYGHRTTKNSIVAGNTATFGSADVLDGEGTTAFLASIVGIPAGLMLATSSIPAERPTTGARTRRSPLTDSATNPARHNDSAICAGAAVNGLELCGLPRTLPCDTGAYEFQP